MIWYISWYDIMPFVYINCTVYFFYYFTESLLNIHEDVRQDHWIPIAFTVFGRESCSLLRQRGVRAISQYAYICILAYSSVCAPRASFLQGWAWWGLWQLCRDMHHVLLTLLVLLEGSLTKEVDEHNRRNPVVLIVNPPPIMVEITIMLLLWYQLYLWKFPAKDEEDIKDLGTLGKRLSLCIFDVYAL